MQPPAVPVFAQIIVKRLIFNANQVHYVIVMLMTMSRRNAAASLEIVRILTIQM